MSNAILVLFMVCVATTLAQDSAMSGRMLWWYGCRLWRYPVTIRTRELEDCRPLDMVYQTTCYGRCFSQAYINPAEQVNYLNDDYNCCKPIGTEKAVAEFQCSPSNGNGGPTVTRKFTYTRITGCGCAPCCGGQPKQ